MVSGLPPATPALRRKSSGGAVIAQPEAHGEVAAGPGGDRRSRRVADGSGAPGAAGTVTPGLCQQVRPAGGAQADRRALRAPDTRPAGEVPAGDQPVPAGQDAPDDRARRSRGYPPPPHAANETRNA